MSRMFTASTTQDKVSDVRTRDRPEFPGLSRSVEASRRQRALTRRERLCWVALSVPRNSAAHGVALRLRASSLRPTFPWCPDPAWPRAGGPCHGIRRGDGAVLLVPRAGGGGDDAPAADADRAA